jgi:hypothetical protein
MHHAAESGCVACARLLLTHGGSPEVRDKAAESPLHKVRFNGYILRSLRGRAQPSLTTSHPRSLVQAAREGHAEMAKWLCLKSGKSGGNNKMRRTPLHLSVLGGHMNATLVGCGLWVGGCGLGVVRDLHQHPTAYPYRWPNPDLDPDPLS